MLYIKKKLFPFSKQQGGGPGLGTITPTAELLHPLEPQSLL